MFRPLDLDEIQVGDDTAAQCRTQPCKAEPQVTDWSLGVSFWRTDDQEMPNVVSGGMSCTNTLTRQLP